MYALTWCYEGCDDNTPIAQTIAVSEDKDKLVAELMNCINEDTQINEDDEWTDDCNFVVYQNFDGYSVLLQHSMRKNLYCRYTITYTNLL